MEPTTTTVKKISSGVWSLEQEMVRCFLIVGQQRAMLLDTGAAPCDLPALIREITPLPLVVLNTHGDGDHTAGDHYFPDIHAHPEEFPIIRRSVRSLAAPCIPSPVFPPLILVDVSFRSLKRRDTPPEASACWITRTGFFSPAIRFPMDRYSSPEIIGTSIHTGAVWSN